MSGKFIDNGRAFEITESPGVPWSNVMTNGRFGSIWTDKGGAFAWCGNSVLDRLTLWNQDLVLNPSKRSIYLLDPGGILRTMTPSPVPGNASWTVIHRMGQTSYISRCHRMETRLDVVVLPGLDAEAWFAEVSFTGQDPGEVRMCSFQDIMLGTWSEAHREFHRLFFESTLGDDSILVFTKRLDTRPGLKEHWNTPFPGAMACGCSEPLSGCYPDRWQFYGYGGSAEDPVALRSSPVKEKVGSWSDPMAGLDVVLKPVDGKAQAVFVTAFGEDQADAVKTARQALSVSRDDAIASVKRFWENQLGDLKIKTPDEDLNISSDWLRYQAISSRIMARCSLYQASGAFGYRDQLQDSLLFLSSDPERTLKQLELHLRHQQRDGSVLHWWHPETETGMAMNCSDDYLWPIMAGGEYYRETGEIGFLHKMVPFLDGGQASIWDHLKLSVSRAWKYRSKRGVPLLGECDWNDGLSSAGDKGAGESFWVAHFLHLLLGDMAQMAIALGEDPSQFTEKASIMADVVNTLGWDGEWYLQGTTDEGDLIGSSACDEGKIHLNPQTWSIISGTASGKYKDRAELALKAVVEKLQVEWGVLLLAPPYVTPDERLGYITRYAPGCRENGGVYTHASVWAGRAARIMGRPDLVQSFLLCLLPPVRGRDPRYQAEPYVTPGNIDGPVTPTPGRGGWTWYTGSASWLFRCLIEDLLGIRAEADGLIVQPNVPREWDGFTVERPFRGRLIKLNCRRADSPGIVLRDPGASIEMKIEGSIIPVQLMEKFPQREILADVAYRAD